MKSFDKAFLSGRCGKTRSNGLAIRKYKIYKRICSLIKDHFFIFWFEIPHKPFIKYEETMDIAIYIIIGYTSNMGK